MKYLRCMLLTITLFASPYAFADKKDTVSFPIEWYKERYPYIGDWGKVFTCETEFTFPKDFKRFDSSKLTPFQHWVSFMPLWHFDKGVGSLRKGTVYKSTEISRSVRFPWRTSRLTDAVIPLQVALEYLIWKQNVDHWLIEPKAGQGMTYAKWLSSSISYGPDSDIRFDSAQTREPSVDELKQFFELVSLNTSYGSLARNSDSIAYESAMPGDILIGQNEEGAKGKVYIILNVLQKKKERLYLVGTGCDFGCDLYIPLHGTDRTSPWLTKTELIDLIKDWPKKGAYRLKLP